MVYKMDKLQFVYLSDVKPVVDAIPVEWLCRKMREEENNGNILKAEYLKELIWEFHQDDGQEAQDG
jgi:hypothetical protein